jgi:hypothetical protein
MGFRVRLWGSGLDIHACSLQVFVCVQVRTTQTGAAQREVLRATMRSTLLEWRSQTFLKHKARSLLKTLTARHNKSLLLRTLTIVLSYVHHTNSQSKSSLRFSARRRAYRRLAVLLAWRSRIAITRFRRQRNQCVVRVCRKGVCIHECSERGVLCTSFDAWREVGSAWRDRLEEVKRMLLASHGAGGKAVCLRWVVFARQLAALHRNLIRSAHLAKKAGSMARISLVGRHWLETLYSILGLAKGHLFAGEAHPNIDICASRNRVAGVHAHAELQWARGEIRRFSSRTMRLCLFFAWRSLCRRLRRVRTLKWRFLRRSRRASLVRCLLLWRLWVSSSEVQRSLDAVAEAMSTWTVFVAFSGLFLRRDEERAEGKALAAEAEKKKERERETEAAKDKESQAAFRHQRCAMLTYTSTCTQKCIHDCTRFMSAKMAIG